MPATITCVVCGGSAQVKRYKAATAKYCSHACRLVALHKKLKEDRPKAEFVCHQCGQSFRRSPSSGPNKFCSRSCYDVAQSNRPEDVFSRVDQSGGPDACWPWLGPVTVWGYGATTLRRVMHNAHRVAYMASRGSVPPGMVVMHTCDNRLCCNPAHLRAGTQQENMQDMATKGRTRHQKSAVH